MYYPRIDETVTFRRLKNGLPAYVVHKPGYTRKYAMFATRYGGMDLRFQQDGRESAAAAVLCVDAVLHRRERGQGAGHYCSGDRHDRGRPGVAGL